jgi:hypothetical protein
MSDERLVRLQNLQAYVRRRGLSPNDLVAKLGSRYSFWRDLLVGDKTSFGEKLARRIEDGLDLPKGWLDSPGDGDLEPPSAVTVAKEPTGAYSIPPNAAAATLSPRALQLARLYDAASDERKGRFEAAMTLVGLKVPAPDDIMGAPQSAPAARPPEGFEVTEGGRAPARHGRGKGVKR